MKNQPFANIAKGWSVFLIIVLLQIGLGLRHKLDILLVACRLHARSRMVYIPIFSCEKHLLFILLAHSLQAKHLPVKTIS